jgi:hypothetical protein
MKIKSSCYVLAVEILTITMFHVFKVRQAEIHQTDIVSTKEYKTPLHQPVSEKKSDMVYVLEHLIK